jgi:uncharacterized 2Fe-2S/4Fe-4S cluster protein (DUF4445 family)
MQQYGISVDIGTHKISLRIFDTTTGEIHGHVLSENPQNRYGLDIITRCRNALANHIDLTSELRSRINEMIENILSRVLIERNSLKTAIIVGNSIMHHIFFDLDFTPLINEPFLTSYRNSMDIYADSVDLDALGHISCLSPPLIGSFIGSDAVALGVSSSILNSNETNLAIDIGANSEFILSHGGRILAASAASGPAFEGMSLECGVSNRTGAITSIKISDDLSHVGYVTLNSGSAIGICGTGAISTLAEFVRKGVITSYGSFNKTIRSPLLSLKSTPPFFMISKDVTISQYDLRLLQQSKAAIGATIATLLDRFDLNASDISTLYLAGQFGAAIVLNDAYDIDMFPSFDNASLQQEAYAANLGAETIIVNKIPLTTLNDFVSRIEHVDLMEDEQFDAEYVQALQYSKASR